MMDFATAPRSFSRGERINTDGAFWAHRGVREGLPPCHLWGLDWPRCFHGLGVVLGQHEVRRLELTVAQQAWATSPIARRSIETDEIDIREWSRRQV